MSEQKEPSDLEKIFVYLAEAEKERIEIVEEINSRIDEVISEIEKLKVIWEK